MNRTWFYQRMFTSPALTPLLPGGIHETTAIERTPHLKPFIIYRVIAHRPENRGDDQDVTRTENFLVFVHDVPGDYLRIDTLLRELKLLFVNAKDTAAGVSRVTWLEDSEDFRDEDMGTIMKYARFSVRYLPSEVVL